jgi:hypothetical protein
VAQHGANDLRLVAEPRCKQRPQWPVNQARDEGFLFRRTAFTLEKATGNFAGGEGLFLIVDGQRKKILPGLGVFHRDGGAQHRRLAIGGEHRAVGLARELSGFEGQAAPAPHQLFAINW